MASDEYRELDLFELPSCRTLIVQKVGVNMLPESRGVGAGSS